MILADNLATRSRFKRQTVCCCAVEYLTDSRKTQDRVLLVAHRQGEEGALVASYFAGQVGAQGIQPNLRILLGKW